MTMCEGVWPASWMIHSPRSVSPTSMPPASRWALRWISSEAMDLDLTTRFDAVVLGQARMYSFTCPGSLVRNTLAPSGLGVALEGFGQLVQVAGGCGLDLPDPAPHRLEIDALVGLGPADPVGLGEPPQGAGEVGVVQCDVDGFPEGRFHALPPSSSSTNTTMSRSGPCTPMVRTRSMSAVRLGPVIKEM